MPEGREKEKYEGEGFLGQIWDLLNGKKGKASEYLLMKHAQCLPMPFVLLQFSWAIESSEFHTADLLP